MTATQTMVRPPPPPPPRGPPTKNTTNRRSAPPQPPPRGRPPPPPPRPPPPPGRKPPPPPGPPSSSANSRPSSSSGRSPPPPPPPPPPRRVNSSENLAKINGGSSNNNNNKRGHAVLSPSASSSLSNKNSNDSNNNPNKKQRRQHRRGSVSIRTPTVMRDVDAFEKKYQVGEGTYGSVFVARDRTSNEIVAMKRINTEQEENGFPITALREVKLLKGLSHPNMVILKECVCSKGTYVSSKRQQQPKKEFFISCRRDAFVHIFPSRVGCLSCFDCYAECVLID